MPCKHAGLPQLRSSMGGGTAMRRKKLRLKLEEWPPRDRAAWADAITPGVAFDDDGAACHLSEGARQLALKGYGPWLHFLLRRNELDPDLAPASRAASPLVKDYVAEITARCNVHTASIYLRSLRVALRVLDPEGECEPVVVQARRLTRLTEGA